MTKTPFLVGAFLVTTLPLLGAQASIDVGDEAPDFDLQDASGTRYKLSDYQGEKNVVIEFFRSGSW